MALGQHRRISALHDMLDNDDGSAFGQAVSQMLFQKPLDDLRRRGPDHYSSCRIRLGEPRKAPRASRTSRRPDIRSLTVS